MKITIENALTFGGLTEGKLVAGFRGIHNIIESVTVLEVADPYSKAWNLPNQLHVTALYAIRDDLETQLAVIRSLKEAGCSGIVLCHLGHFIENIASEVIDVCNDLAFPLIVVPKTVTYIEIIVPIVNRILEISNEKNQLALEIQETLLQKVIHEEGLGSICQYLGEKLNASIVIIDVMDKILASYGCAPDEIEQIYGELHQCRERILTNTTYTIIQPEKAYYVYPILNEETRYGYLVCEINSLDLEYVLLMLKHTAIACSLLVTHHERRSRMQQMYINDFIKNLVDSNEKEWDEVKRTAFSLHWDLEHIGALLLIVTTALDPSSLLIDIKHILLQQDIRQQCGVVGEHVVLFLDDTADRRRIADLLLQSVLKHHPRLSRDDIAVSVSSQIHEPENIPEVYKVAVDTLILGKRFLPQQQIYDCDTLAFLPSLYENAEAENFQNIARRILQPILEYDLEHNHELMNTLDALLLNDHAMQGIADSLHIHRNTLQYRRKKIIELLGEDPFAGLHRINYILAVFTIKF
ncbi:MAG: PucR family transcriptional regulator ligand-binding domain-containing protein [Sphaerochaetaceae bacterium]|nr:PucR family transcriptional regulator ligand-binding domain-containing protein [Sphaerochaetaceae bacterium]